MTTRFTLPDLSSMEIFAKDIAKILHTISSHRGAYVVTLSGELGAGKTTFVQSLARELGIRESVQSPTFVLAKSYETAVSWPKRIVHIDAYRLNGFNDLRPLDWEREVGNTDTLILLEWPECVAPLSPLPDMQIVFSVESQGGRTATLKTKE
jgi:tRNA threonylcarbamoyladenosine biosynthesis protein TsaE